MPAVKLDAPPGLISGSPVFLFFKFASGSSTISSAASILIASPLSTISCSILARHSSVFYPIPRQPGHPAARPYLSKIFCRKYTLFARLPLSNSSFCWTVGVCCVLLAQELQIPSIVTFQTSHTACLHCTCWRQQQKFIGAVKLADKKLLAPTSCSIWLHPLSDFGPNKFLQVAPLLQCSTKGRSPGALHLEIVHIPCTVSNHPAHQHMVRSNSCLVSH